VTFGSPLRFTRENRQERYREATKEMMHAIARVRDAEQFELQTELIEHRETLRTVRPDGDASTATPSLRSASARRPRMNCW
jgi:hypothetical protein